MRLQWALILALSPSTWGAAGLARDHGTPRNPAVITTIVVHTVGGPVCTANRIWFAPISRRPDDAAVWQRALRSAPAAEAHYVIGRTGGVEQVLPVAEVAHHTKGANDISIGIELVHRGDGREPFEPGQIAALVALIKKLRHDLPGIAFNNVVGHDDLDRRTCLCNGVPFARRQDPGANFPWNQVLAAIRLPSDPSRGKPSLAPFEGPAPRTACPIF